VLLAVLFQHEDAVRFLLQRGADANPRIESGHHNLLAMAKTKGNAQIVALLTAAGAKEE